MPRWNNNPVDVTLGMQIYEGFLRLRVTDVKPFANALKENATVQSGGVRVVHKIVGGEHDGKPFVTNCYLHNEGSLGFTKQYQCAIYGFVPDKEGEEKFNAFAADKDWSVDTDANTLGDAWKSMLNREVNVEATKGINKTNNNEQQNSKYLPI